MMFVIEIQHMKEETAVEQVALDFQMGGRAKSHRVAI